MNWRVNLSPIRFLTRSGALWVCLLGLWICDVRSASASCGDYLHGHGAADGRLADNGPLTAGGNLPANSLPAPRCHGPHCQRDNQAPAAPSKAIEIPATSDAILTNIALLVRPDGSFALLLDQAVAVDGSEGRIFRPPRVA